MRHLKIVRTSDELIADETRERLLFAIDRMDLTMGQVARLKTLIAAYGVAQRKAGESRGEANRLPENAA